MYERMLDVLRGLGTVKHEVELRIALPDGAFEHARGWFDAGENRQPRVYTVGRLQDSDLRRVGDKWEHKRVVDTSPIHVVGLMRAKLAVSLELEAVPPGEEVTGHPLFFERQHTRWSYPMGHWRVDWTKCDEYANVELEWTGDNPQKLADCPRLDGLDKCLRRLVPCTAFLMYYGAYCDIDSTGIFIRPVWSIGNVAKEHIDISFRQQQPVSLLRENMCRLHTHLVSVKYDGVRVAACFMEVEGIPICMLYGKRCRRIRCAYAPCSGKVDPCVLDAELMDDGTVVAFDIIQHNNRYLAESPFQYRVDLLNTLQLPKVHAKDVVVKQFWPAASVNLALEKMADVASDGLVFHNPHALLRDSGSMHKWKPRHTVDLKVAGNMRLRTRLATVQSLDPRYHEQCKKDEIWEFEFNTEGNFKLVPVRKRDDKAMPNADQTYRDVKKAHEQNITTQELIQVLS